MNAKPSQSTLTLFFSPGACSRVALEALEITGVGYIARAIALSSGEQRQACYRALNPKGKVPLLLTSEGTLSEIVAIVSWLDMHHPQAVLLPGAENSWMRAQALSWLSWSVSTLHGLVFRLRMASRIHPDPQVQSRIQSVAMSELAEQLAVAERALADGRPWLCGEAWNIADSHVCWAVGRAMDSGWDSASVPHLAGLLARQHARPTFQRALARESQPA
jgi:glutathione S-transferase